MRIRTILTICCIAVTASIFAQPGPTTLPCGTGTNPPCADDRGAFVASAYLGEVVDTFAGDATINYLNPNDANKSSLRGIGGVDFAYRLMGDQGARKQLWIYGETIHGVRSRDVDCSASNNAKLSVCQQNNFDPANSGGQFIAILRGASSLEAYTGIRYEFPPPLQNLTDSPARLYVSAQAGFMSVAGGGGDVVDNHHIGFGALAVKGKFEGSFLELGIGRNDVFKRHSTRRALIDGYLTLPMASVPLLGLTPAGLSTSIQPFIEFTGDFDLGSGSDSVQTWFGLDFHFK